MPSSLTHATRSIQRRIVRTVEHDWLVQKARFRRWRGLEASVLSIVDGGTNHPGEKHAIFVIWQLSHTSWSVWNMLEALDQGGINVTLVVNHPLADERLEALAKRCARVMMRDNSGRDIGGYRDATRFLQREFQPERVLYLNDSVFIFERGLAALLDRLVTSPADACSAFENWQQRHHYQSFCFSVSGTFFRSAAWQQFWDDYLPVDSRLWAIRKGEIGASAVISRSAASSEVIFTPAELQRRLSALPGDELQALNGCLPKTIRLPASNALHMDRHSLLREMIEQMITFSQIHTGGILFRRFMDCPLMKRDLVFRNLYSINEIDILLDEVDHEGHRADILAELRKRGSGSARGSWDRARIRVGTL